MLEEGYQLMANCVSNNKSEHSVRGASDNVCSENTLHNDSSNILTADQKLSTEAPPKSKPKTKTKLPPQKKGSLPLTVCHQNIPSERESNGVVKPIIPNFPSYTLFF